MSDMTAIGVPTCICDSNRSHFCPPSMGEPGFYACNVEDVQAHVRALKRQVRELKDDNRNLRKCPLCKATDE